MKRIIAAYQWHVFRDDCANGCLRVAQTVALESAPPNTARMLLPHHATSKYVSSIQISKILNL